MKNVKIVGEQIGGVVTHLAFVRRAGDRNLPSAIFSQLKQNFGELQNYKYHCFFL